MTLWCRNSKSLLSGLIVLFCCCIIPIEGQSRHADADAGNSNSKKDTTSVIPGQPSAVNSIVVKDTTLNGLSADSSSVRIKQDSLRADSLSKDSIIRKNRQTINDVVDYEAQDSLVFFADGNIGRLYGQGKVTYGEMNLDAGFIQMNQDSSLLYAVGRTDTTGTIIEDPDFKDKSGEYKAKNMLYNFKTKKGMIHQAITQQGEGYIVSGTTKKLSDDVMCMVNGKYTTCDHFDHPDFYLALSKAKVKPGDYIVSGPAHLVMEDVDLPLFIPFGYFPFSSKYSSGILTPTYGDELARGFYLKDGGYYFAFSDYMDLALTGELYSKGSWGMKAKSSYRVRYKYSGNFNFSYLVTIASEKNLPDYAKASNMSVTWSHAQDSKSNPYRTLSANVNFATSGYSRSDLGSYYNAEVFSSNTKSSTINVTQRFPEGPFSAFSLNASTSISQRSSDSTLSVSLPSLSISMSSLSPFKRKNAVGNERWYEKIRMSYSGSFSNNISQVKESEILHKSLIKDWQNQVTHSLPISATFNVLNYINITPSISYTERWYSSSFDKHWDKSMNSAVTDTTWGFNRVWDYSTSVSASTKLYGMYQPWQKLFGDKINMIRHVMTPTVSFSYRPDFGAARYHYYGNYSYTDSTGIVHAVNYARYASTPGKGTSGSIGFSIANNVEMKIKQQTDTATVFKKVSLIDNFSFGSNYNMAADSLNWSNISASIRLKFGPRYTLNLSGSFDPYTYQVDGNGNPYQVNVTQFHKYGIPGRLISTGTSFSYSINNNTFKKKDKAFQKPNVSGDNPQKPDKPATDGNSPSNPSSENKSETSSPQGGVSDPEAALYQPFMIPFNLSVSYSLNYQRSSFNKERLEYNHTISQNLSLSGDISLTDKWKMNASTSYNFSTKQFAMMNCSVSRDLHCWEMTASFIPFGVYKSYNFSIRVKSSMLQSLKYEQHQNPNDNYIWGN
jgi:hypothetical protein